jgi:hypothetical protein
MDFSEVFEWVLIGVMSTVCSNGLSHAAVSRDGVEKLGGLHV